ncbi:Multiple inositol polyphosphate phosphatase [Nesidiocoris tenuis]|uniref:Multiple inositol polyphosphate phosphatase 1 n=1 Tax=Nesidiocoris tenuis TaxID=355587 RepID=A0ABN7B6I6_9HEMI|nr:Multiple inositol polyphosphate phosphatase [Nesidiocoris tenuis]
MLPESLLWLPEAFPGIPTASLDLPSLKIPSYPCVTSPIHVPGGKLCAEDLDGLKRWHYKYQPSDLGQLAEEGKADLRMLAGGYKLSLPELFANVTPDKTTVKFTNVKRTRDSAEAFLYALNKNVDWNLSDSNEAELLMLDKNCTQWINSRETESAVREKKAFLATPDIKTTLSRVSQRLGFAYDLDFKTVKAMYDLCRNEKAVYYQKAPVSPWCCAFEKVDLETLEYYMDLKYYYDSGYGNPITMKLGCPLTRDMLLKFENVTKNNGTTDVNPLTLYFAHSVTLRSVITKLGLARDQTAPKHDNRGLAAVKDRQWRTSRISPFTGNLFAVLYRCTTGEEWKIMFYLNEHLVHYEGCNLGLCDWSYIIDRFRDHIDRDTCNADFCDDPNSSPDLKPTFVLSLTAVSILLRLIL